jgi:hypothetical protein
MARFYSCAQAQADGLTTTAGLVTSRERIATTTIRVRQDEAQGPKERSCPFLGLHMRGHKVNLDRDTTAGRGAAVRSRRDRERSVLTTQCSMRTTAGTTSADGQAGCARAVDGSGTCRRKARLEGRHTSDGVCAAARSSETRGKGRAKPRLGHRENKRHEGQHRDSGLGTRHHLRACCRGSSISSNASGATGTAAKISRDNNLVGTKHRARSAFALDQGRKCRGMATDGAS